MKQSKKKRDHENGLYILRFWRIKRDVGTHSIQRHVYIYKESKTTHILHSVDMTVLSGKFASFESWNSGFWRKRGVRFEKQNYYWLLLQVSRMKWIMYSDWLLEQASWPHRMFVPQEKSSLGHLINPLLTKLVWLRRLDISLMFFFFTILLPLHLSQSIIITSLPNKLTWPLSSHLWPHTWY